MEPALGTCNVPLPFGINLVLDVCHPALDLFPFSHEKGRLFFALLDDENSSQLDVGGVNDCFYFSNAI
jgi:hypothetical protein